MSGEQGNRKDNKVPGFFALYTQRAREVVVHAQAEARAIGHSYIGAEHLLLGLLRADNGVARSVLNGHGIGLREAREEVRRKIGRGSVPEGTKPPRNGQLAFAPQVKAVLRRTALEAQWLEDDRHIGTEHLLLGLVGKGGGVAAEVLNARGASPGKVREEVMLRVRRGRTQP